MNPRNPQSPVNSCKDITPDATGMFNAKAQRPKRAKSSFLLCDFATLRLFVEKSFLSVKSVKSVVQFFYLRRATLRILPPFAAVPESSIRNPQSAIRNSS
jgi:hypothetical protein